MRRLTLVLLLLLGGTGLAASAPTEAVTFYVQLIRGTDTDTPPAPEARLIGSELGRRLRVFKWRTYWEMGRRTVVLRPGAKSRQRLSPQREVEIALLSPQDMTVSIYTAGRLSRRRRQAADTAFCIAGGEHENAESWFIVVRRDDPQLAQASVK
jgi:hypothetical protein